MDLSKKFSNNLVSSDLEVFTFDYYINCERFKRFFQVKRQKSPCFSGLKYFFNGYPHVKCILDGFAFKVYGLTIVMNFIMKPAFHALWPRLVG